MLLGRIRIYGYGLGQPFLSRAESTVPRITRIFNSIPLPYLPLQQKNEKQMFRASLLLLIFFPSCLMSLCDLDSRGFFLDVRPTLYAPFFTHLRLNFDFYFGFPDFRKIPGASLPVPSWCNFLLPQLLLGLSCLMQCFNFPNE
jgi:hypothetical protein